MGVTGYGDHKVGYIGDFRQALSYHRLPFRYNTEAFLYLAAIAVRIEECLFCFCNAYISLLQGGAAPRSFTFDAVCDHITPYYIYRGAQGMAHNVLRVSLYTLLYYIG